MGERKPIRSAADARKLLGITREQQIERANAAVAKIKANGGGTKLGPVIKDKTND